MNIVSTKYFLFLFFITATFLPTPSQPQAVDTLNSSQIFSDNGTTLLSSGGTFEFGFFNASNSGNRYVGIWYRRISARTVVWTANRDSPLTDASGTLRILGTGILVLVNGTNGTVWSTNTSRSVQNPVAQLLDSGNLVVRDANDDNPENYLWQSFDYPTDTFLPGMRLGVNVTSGHEVFITSRRNSDDLASGDYTYHCDPTGYPQNVIRRGTEVVFRTGPWNGITLNGGPNLQNDGFFTYGMVINGEEVYYYYEVRNETIYSRFTISPTGVGERWLWGEQTQNWDVYLTIPIDACDSYNRCGPHSSCDTGETPPCSCLDKFEPRDPEAWGSGDWFGGCIRRTPLNWTNGDGFLKYSRVKLPDTRRSSNNITMSLEECRVFCLNNRTCTAYASLNISRVENGCLFWYGDLVDMNETPTGQDIYIRMASSELGSKGRRRKILIVTLSVVIGVLLLSAMLFLYLRRRKQRDHHQLEEIDTTRLNYAANHPDDTHSKDPELPLFDLSTISKATDGFSSKNKIGQGGFGTVYMGILGDGLEIAVKRLSKTSHQGLDEFKNEVICIAKLQHRNLVKLLGWCIQGEEMMLVYEYMPNKSLNAKLFDPAKSILLDWPTRFNIINGVARGLMYLHQDSRLRVIHRDLKTSNILLDSDMNPKISDFGLARTFGGNESGGGTSRIVGTYGYMSPEYVVDGLFSVKSDVYSYGVVVLEIVSGKKNRGFTHRDHRLNLLGHAWMLHSEERSTELIDSCLLNSINISEAVRSIHVGLLCVQENPDDRPIMSSVVMMLTNDGVLPQPKRPGFFTDRQMLTIQTSASSNTDTSKNIVTITQLDAR